MKQLSLILSLAAVALFTVSCDKIDNPHKPFTPAGGDKTVLITDFTGVRCVNCPAAAETAHELQHKFGEDKVFIMSVHAGFLAQPVGNFPDFTTEEGALWYGENNSNPLFAVDHIDIIPGEGNCLYIEQVDSPLSQYIVEPQTFNVQIYNEYDEETRILKTETDIVAIADVAGDFYMTSCIVEDSIIGPQVTSAGLDAMYVHRNVFRKTINGAYGDTFLEGQIYVNDEYDYKYEIQLDSTYNADQCYILSYVYEKKTKKIFQTAMTKIK